MMKTIIRKNYTQNRNLSGINRITILFFLLFAFLLNTPNQVYGVPSESLYVSLTGSDNNPGTETLPFRTIQHAVDSVDPGETIFIMGGVYNESVKINRSGTNTNPIRITKYDNQSITIKGGNHPALIPYKQLPQYWTCRRVEPYSLGQFTVLFDSWGSDGSLRGHRPLDI